MTDTITNSGDPLPDRRPPAAIGGNDEPLELGERSLAHIVNSIQHNFTQDLQQWEHLNQQQQAFSQQAQGFDYALNGVDLFSNPTIGATFEAPYDTYRATGPAGPGYYDQANNKLRIETP